MTYDEVAGRYTLQREIGRGSSGAVWLAADEVLGRQVALKRIGLSPAAGSPDVERAEREARLAAQVVHPNVVAVFDFVAGSDAYWLVMEYVDGTDLAQIIRERGPLPPEDAARILGPAAEGLAAAHALGIVHRDVKPSNILVGDDGAVKLSDFGIARGLGDPSLTQTGLITGSPAYLAPEVATGGSATTESDVWSVGATLHHALGGQPPYHRDEAEPNPLATLYRIAHEPTPTLTTEAWATSLLAATMDRDPGRRPSASEVAARLHGAAAGDTTTQMMPAVQDAPVNRHRSPRPPHRLLAGLAVLLVALVLVGGFLLLDRDDEPTATADDAATTAPADPTTTPSESEEPPTAAELEDFARDYVATASGDPAAGFAMLTPDYQAASPDYREFWGSVRNPRILEVSGDPDALQVGYTYEYSLPGQGRRTEDVVLQLVQEDGELLIAGDASR